MTLVEGHYTSLDHQQMPVILSGSRKALRAYGLDFFLLRCSFEKGGGRRCSIAPPFL